MASGIRITEEEALKVLYELEPEYKFYFDGGYKKAINKNLHVTCDKGHEYITTYNKFVNNKTRCKQCFYTRRKHNEEEALKVLQGLEPKYTFKFEGGYKKVMTKNLNITCNHGHEYITSYDRFQQGRRCPHCAGNIKYTEDEALKTLYELEPSYTFNFKDGYINNSTKNLHICCDKGHEFITTYSKFQQGHRCPHCANFKSKPEIEIINYIKLFYFKDIIQGDRTLIKNKYSNRYMELDIYLPDIKLAIEFNGVYWHSDKKIKERKKGFSNAKEYHEYKSKQCQDIGIHLIHIDEEHYISNKNTILQNIKSRIQQHINPNINLS